jgi:hypothetical protein
VAPLYTHEYLRSLGARHLIIDEMDQASVWLWLTVIIIGDENVQACDIVSIVDEKNV